MKQLQLCVHSCPWMFIEEQALSEDLRSFLACFISKVELGYYLARIHFTFPFKSIDPNLLYPSKGTTTGFPISRSNKFKMRPARWVAF
jgi:hypothetical protein